MHSPLSSELGHTTITEKTLSFLVISQISLSDIIFDNKNDQPLARQQQQNIHRDFYFIFEGTIILLFGRASEYNVTLTFIQLSLI